MSTTTPTTTTRDRGDHYGPIEWAQSSYTVPKSKENLGALKGSQGGDAKGCLEEVCS